jgi:hypothetical protein
MSSHRRDTDRKNYYREVFTKLFNVNPRRAEEIQAMGVEDREKITLLEAELPQEQPASDPGISLCAEVVKLREQVAQLTQAVRGLVQLQSVANQKLDVALKGGVGADFAVLG